MPLITIMIPVYNGEQFVAEAVQSALSQPLKDIEVLLLNDGSTDGTYEICNKLALSDSRITVSHHENVGLGENRNRGYNLIHGKWLIFLDHDDVLIPDVLSEGLSDSLMLCDEADVGMIVTSRTRGDAHLSNLFLDPIPLNGLHEASDGCSWQLPYELATNIYRSRVVLDNNLRFETSRPEMESIFRHQAAYLSGKIIFCRDASLEIRRGSSTQITRTWNQLHMRAVRIAGYSKLPEWHREHKGISVDINRAYAALSKTIEEFFLCALIEHATFDAMTEALQGASVPKSALEQNKHYSVRTNRILKFYHEHKKTSIRLISFTYGVEHLINKYRNHLSGIDESQPITQNKLEAMASSLPQEIVRNL